MLKLRISPGDVGGQWSWTGSRWQAGTSWIEPYEHPGLERLDPSADRLAMVVRERCRGMDGHPHHPAWLGDFITVQPRDGALWLEAGASGVAPLYLIERDGVLHGSWDVTDLREQLRSAALVPREVARLLGMRFRYAQETLWAGLYRLTERSRATFGPDGLRLCSPLPAAHSMARDLHVGADVAAAYEQLLDRAVNRHAYTPQSAAVELSGGLDSANVAASLGARHPGQVTATALMILDEPGRQQRHRREQMIDIFGLGDDITTDMADHLPLSPGGRRATAQAVTAYEDPYDEAKAVLLDRLRERGVRTVFTGVGGDEMVSLTSAEQPHAPFGVGLQPMPWIGEHTSEALTDAEHGVAPATVVNEMTLISQACAAPPMLRAGMWPVHPLADTDLIRFGEWLPRPWRERKHVHRARLHHRGCSPELLQPPLPENFAPVMQLGIRRHGLPYLRRMLDDGAILIEERFIDPDGLAATVDRLADSPFASRDTELYGVIAVETALRSFAGPPSSPVLRPARQAV